MKTKIIVDSASDILRSIAEELDISVLPLQVTFGDKTYNDYYELDSARFFELLKTADQLPTTNLIPLSVMYDEFKKNLDSFDHQVFITISSKGSGTHGAALLAKEQLEKDLGKTLPITIFDTKSFCGGESLIAENAALLAKEGKPLEEIIKCCEHFRDNQKCIVAASSLKHLAKGGRIKTSTAVIGEILNVRPIITIDDGLMAQVGKERGFKKTKERFAKFILDNVKDKQNVNLWYMQSCNEAEMGEIASEVRKHITPVRERVISLGAVIGTHIGPGVVAVIFNTH